MSFLYEAHLHNFSLIYVRKDLRKDCRDWHRISYRQFWFTNFSISHELLLIRSSLANRSVMILIPDGVSCEILWTSLNLHNSKIVDSAVARDVVFLQIRSFISLNMYGRLWKVVHSMSKLFISRRIFALRLRLGRNFPYHTYIIRQYDF